MSLNGVGLAAAAPMGAPETHVGADMDHASPGSPPCDCCDDELPMGTECQACVCAPGLAAPVLDLGSPIVLAIVHGRPTATRPDSRAPSPLRRPPRLAS